MKVSQICFVLSDGSNADLTCQLSMKMALRCEDQGCRSASSSGFGSYAYSARCCSRSGRTGEGVGHVHQPRRRCRVH